MMVARIVYATAAARMPSTAPVEWLMRLYSLRTLYTLLEKIPSEMMADRNWRTRVKRSQIL